MKLRYPITREYPWRYFTPIVLAVSVSALAILTVINVVTVGYEVISVTRDDFNATQTFWWQLPRQSRKPTCDAHQFSSGDVFFTNVSIYAYNIDFIGQSNKFLYSDVPLGATCSLVYHGVKVDTIQMLVESIAGIQCDGNNNGTLSIMLSYVTRTLVDGRVFSKSSGSVGMFVLDGLAFDLLNGVLAESTNPTTTINILEAGAVTCEGFGNSSGFSITPAQATACANGPVPLFITDVAITYTNRTLSWIQPQPPTDNVTGLPATLEESIPNYLRAASAVILMDIGIWTNNSILVSPTIFNTTITPNTAVTNFLQQNSSFVPPGLPLVSLASLLRGNSSFFIVPEDTRTPAVISISYVCHDYRIKSALRFIVSVVVADASMFSAIWAIFVAVASYCAMPEDYKTSSEMQPFTSADNSNWA